MLKTILLLAALGVCLGVGFAFLWERQTEREMLVEPAPRVAAVESASQIADAVELSLAPAGLPADHALVAYAEAIGKSPECVVAVWQFQMHGEPLPAPECMSDSNAGADALEVEPADPTLETYTDAELESLATVSPEAAVVLARRTLDNAAALALYERAVALSGKPGPLQEYMLWRDLGGMREVDGELDLRRAAFGLEVYLVFEALGYAAPVAVFERELAEAGVDLAPIHARAEARFARLTESRRALVGSSWEVQS